jgi:hypothetical protein
MTAAKRLDIKEGEDLVALEELEGRNITYRQGGMSVHMTSRLALRTSRTGRISVAIYNRRTFDNLAEDTGSRRHSAVNLIEVK